ncbi:carboxymuconolactone decarboxylase [Sphingopyxis lindanitolerans]|uniref:Carboxymuconolactone decarboxylase n=2 Tax=Sphingopyxis lindanitolerans TaxID=2054227 RepID=A0A2S8B4C1_9SPHN|nr:carboxymuconolactone decarboxylase [Sphingopyxis lindanitolerans]
MRANGQWNSAWDAMAALDPLWLEAFLAAGTLPLRRGVLDPKIYEFLAIAVDASCTHLYAPGTRRHIAAALDKGATPEEVMAVLEAVAVLGLHSVALGAPMLVEEMNARSLTMTSGGAA